MEINKVLNVMALYFLPFQIYAKEEITFPIIKETNSTNSGFFYDSFVSSFNYIFNFDPLLFNVVITSLNKIVYTIN